MECQPFLMILINGLVYDHHLKHVVNRFLSKCSVSIFIFVSGVIVYILNGPENEKIIGQFKINCLPYSLHVHNNFKIGPLRIIRI